MKIGLLEFMLSMAGFVRAWGLSDSGDRYFFIHTWPASVVDSWPKEYTFSKRLSIEKEFRANHGVGEQLDERLGLYHTHQYSLYSTFLARLRESRLRTLDPSKASVFFIPYDIGMDATTRNSDGALSQTRCPRVGEAHQLLQNSTYFKRNQGADHFMLNSINQMMLHFLTEECREFLKLCLKCTKLGIDAYDKSVYQRELNSFREMSQGWISIPFPSNYHYSPSTESSTWQIEEKRWYHIAYIGSDMVTAKKQKKLRIALRQECYRRSDPLFYLQGDGAVEQRQHRGIDQTDCFTTNMDTHDSMSSSMFYELPPKRRGESASMNRSEAIEKGDLTHPYAFATFCLMPGGDFPTRKGVLDALLAGCIPVVFQESTAPSQWSWHWVDSETAQGCTHLVSREDFMGNPRRSFDELVSLAWNEEFVQAKRRCLRDVGHRMQYNLPGTGPFDTVDAVDIVLARLLY